MLSENLNYRTPGSISLGIETDASIKAVIMFLRTNLKDFAANKNNHLSLPEESTNQLLCGFLNKRAKSFPFRFQPEYIENLNSGRSPKVDFGTLSDYDKIVISDREYSENDSFFSFEAKRLPTPGSNREKEYVNGSKSVSGGIERFKKGVHGSKIKYAAIVGYVQKEDFDHWFLKINSWINELADSDLSGLWNLGDILECENLSDAHFVELLSNHSRTKLDANLADIQLYHFWINLIPDSV